MKINFYNIQKFIMRNNLGHTGGTNTLKTIKIPPRTHDVNYTYIRRLDDLQNVFWTSSVRSSYVLYPGGDMKIEVIHWPDFIWVSKGSCSCLLFPAFFLCTVLFLWTWIICWSSTLLPPASFAPSWTALIYHLVLSRFNRSFKTGVCFFTFTATQGWDPTKKV